MAGRRAARAAPPGSTTQPSKISCHTLAVAAMAVAALVAACTGPRDLGPSGEPGAPPSSSVTPAPGQDDVRSALLTVDDLPPGFTEIPVPDTSGLGDFEGCPLLETGQSSDIEAEAAVAFTDGTAVVSETILRLPEDSARQAMSGLARVPGECREFTTKVGGVDIAFTLDVLDLAPMGEETVALRLTAQLAGLAELEEHAVTVRHGTILIVTHVASGSADRAVTESIAHAAYEKVAQRR
jgi:hypothetical protein